MQYFTQSEYDEYMASDAWRQKAQQRLKIDGHRCQMCGAGTDETPLSVHHINYRTFRRENPLTDLVSVCPSCHEKIHCLMCRITGYDNYGRAIRGWRDKLPKHIREALKKRGLM